jgi:hypothetical protein
LSATGQREFLAIGRKMAESIDRRRRAMRDDPLFCSATPHRDLGCKLEPGRPEFDVIRWGTSSYEVDAVGNPSKSCSRSGESGQRSLRYSRLFGLATSNKTPLLGRNLGDLPHGGVARHGFIIRHKRHTMPHFNS